MADQLSEVVCKLHEISGIKFGEFKLKGGVLSPVYFDLRVIISKPKLLDTVSKLLWHCNLKSNEADILCGVPYTALPLATLMSVEHDKPSIIRRKEVKQYGTKKIIEGDFQPGQKCLIVEDVITSGSSVLETAAILRDHGMVVEDVVVFLDRQQGGRENLEANGIRVHCVTDATTMMTILKTAGRVTEAEVKTVIDFITKPPAKPAPLPSSSPEWKLSYEQRAAMCSNPMSARILKTMVEKRSNLCVAVDVTKMADLIKITEAVAPYAFAVKTHADMIEDWASEDAQKLKLLAQDHGMLLFEDRKFADIGQTVSHQFNKGPFAIASWCDLVTVHGIAGPGVVQGLQNHSSDDLKGALIVAEMSSEGNLIDAEYSSKCVDMMKKFKGQTEGVATVGLISQSRLCPDPDCVQMTPGVSLASTGDSLGQTYVTVTEALTAKGADAVIVGRGITSAANDSEKMRLLAKEYRDEGWSAYLKRI